MRRNFATALAASAVMGMTAAAPAQFAKPSPNDQVRLGKQASEQIRRDEKVLPASDRRVQKSREVARRLLSTVDDKNRPWEYTIDVIDNAQVNAFALPGGPIYLYTGLLDRMKSEDELAAVLAHELVHVRNEHWALAYRDHQQRNAIFTIGALLLRPSRDVLNIASIGKQLVLDLPYSRRAENESDAQGYDMMVRAGYNPQGLVELFRTLGTASKGSRPPEWMSTHPTDTTRIRNIENRIRNDNRPYPQLRPLPWAR